MARVLNSSAKSFITGFAVGMLILLIAYSAVLVGIDLQLGKEFTRGFFSDILVGKDYPLPYRVLYGINTSLSVALLVVIACLFLVCAGLRRYAPNPLTRPVFEITQVMMFLLAACDERLMIHEKLGRLTHVDDAVYIMMLGVVELVLLCFPGRLLRQPWALKGWVVPVGICFLLTAILDRVFPTTASELLTLEDLAKTWALVFMCLYSWKYCMYSLSTAFGQPLFQTENGQGIRTE